jgi:hypothetical protein
MMTISLQFDENRVALAAQRIGPSTANPVPGNSRRARYFDSKIFLQSKTLVGRLA